MVFDSKLRACDLHRIGFPTSIHASSPDVIIDTLLATSQVNPSVTDSLKRQWQLLRAIPREPQRRSTTELLQALKDEGHRITIRSVQRDLSDLSADWGFTNDVEGKAHYWYWPKGFRMLDIPGLDSSQALVFHLAKQYLASALPASQIRQLAPYFDQADQVLADEAKKLTRWRNRVRMLSRGPQLAVPDVPLGVATVIHEALLKAQRVNLQYRKRGETEAKEYVASIHALIVKDGVTYGVVTFLDYTDLRHIALHRVIKVEALDEAATRLPAFDLDAYIQKEAAFAYPSPDSKQLRLQLRINARVAEHLSERPLSDDQQINPDDDGKSLLTATVPNTAELRWWLRGFGSNIEVVGPKSLRDKMVEMLRQMQLLYAN